MDPTKRPEIFRLAEFSSATPDVRRPMYSQVYELLRGEIENGTWRPLQLIPTEIELGQRFGVSPGTVKQAVLALVRDGLLTRRSGKGTFVTKLDLSQGLVRFFRFHDKKSGAHLDPDIRFVSIKVLKKTSADIASKLGISKGTPAVKLVRLMTQSGFPVCLHVSFMAQKMVRGLEKLEKEEFSKDTLYEILEKKFDISVMRAQELLSAVTLSGQHAALLKIPSNHPVILIERTAFTYGGVIVEWRQTFGRSDKFRYQTELP